MALVTSIQEICTPVGSKNVNVIEVAGTGLALEFILQDALDAISLKHLTDADTLGTGATFKDKMQSYTIPTIGKTAFQVYGNAIKVLSDYKDNLSNVEASRMSVADIRSLQTNFETLNTTSTCDA